MAKQGLRLEVVDGRFRIGSGKISGFAAVAQNAMVDFLTVAGSDAMFPTRGTTLLTDVYAGAAALSATAVHIANFASLDTKVFARSNMDCAPADAIARVIAQPVRIVQNRLHLTIDYTSASGQAITATSTLA